MAVPSERNIAAKEVEKLSKYKDLETEIGKMWNTKTIVIPLVIGALGIIRNGMKRYVEQLPGKIMIEELQKDCSAWNCSHAKKNILHNPALGPYFGPGTLL